MSIWTHEGSLDSNIWRSCWNTVQEARTDTCSVKKVSLPFPPTSGPPENMGTVEIFHNLCCWHIIRNVTWYLMKVQIYEILCNICLFSSSSLCPVLAVSVLYFENKLGIGCVNISKIHNFVRYQITFLMTCQQH